MFSIKDYLAQSGVLQNYKAGEILFDAGETVTGLFQIQQGKVKMVRYLADGTEPVIHYFNSGDIVAESSLFSENYHCRAKIVVDTSIIRFPKSVVLTEFAASHEFSMQYIQMLSRKIRDLRTLSEIKSIRCAQQRLLRYLISEADSNNEFNSLMSFKDLAALIGLTHETLYRALKSLEKSGKILRDKNRIQIMSI